MLVFEERNFRRMECAARLHVHLRLCDHTVVLLPISFRWEVRPTIDWCVDRMEVGLQASWTKNRAPRGNLLRYTCTRMV
jgi:hypothetical protein